MQKDTTSQKQVETPTRHTVANATHILNECSQDDMSITRNTGASCLHWIGDNIGQPVGAKIEIVFAEADGTQIRASIAGMLIMSNRIQPDERRRIFSALRHQAERGELHPEDLHAYRAWEKDNRTAAALNVGEVTSLMFSLNWAGEKCEDVHDFEQFHVLALELIPRMALSLERAVERIGCAPTGLFSTVEGRP